MVAIAEILTSEGNAKKLCTRGNPGLEKCSYRYNAEIENYYVRNRCYSPTLGRWPNRDPIGYQGGINLYEYSVGRSAQAADPQGTGPAFVVFSTQNYWRIGGLIGYCHGTCTCGVGAPYAPSLPVTEAAVTAAMFVAKEACCVESCDACGLLGAGRLQPKAMTVCLTKAMNLVYLFSAVSCNCS